MMGVVLVVFGLPGLAMADECPSGCSTRPQSQPGGMQPTCLDFQMISGKKKMKFVMSRPQKLNGVSQLTPLIRLE